MSDIHYNCANYFGRDPEVAMECLSEDLGAEYEKAPYDALLLLGDYSLDHWAWQTKGTYLGAGVSNTKAFVEKYLPRLLKKGVEVRMIPGNHEQYGDELWNAFTGHKRQEHIVLGDILFILGDAYGADLDPIEHSDGTYVGADVEKIRALMAEYPDKKVILCAHWFDVTRESEDFRRLLCEEERILCLFCGHNHKSIIMNTGDGAGNKPILCTGHYSYSGEVNNILCPPGYRVLEFDESGLACKYVAHSHAYQIEGVSFTTEYAEINALYIPFR